MRVDTLRFLDRGVGLPLCLLFTLARSLFTMVARRPPLPRPRKILVIKLSEMGSTVLAWPSLAELKKRCPEAGLFFLVFKEQSDLIEVLGLAPRSNIIEVDTRLPSRLFSSGFSALSRLLRERIDTTIDMEFFSRLTALTAFTICRGNRVGFHRYTSEGLNRGNLLTHRVLYSPHVHTSAAYMALVRTLFEKPDDEPHYRGRIDPSDLVLPRYKPPPEDVSVVRRKLEEAGVTEGSQGPILLINPNSSEIFPLRKWPLEYFSQLSKSLLERLPSCWLVITGVASERPDAEYIRGQAQSSRLIDFTGKTNFRELLALYSVAKLMVTNDSGPAHFASLLSLPTVVLFGPETPRLYSPLGNKHRDLYAEFACSPCVSVYNGKRSPCTDNRCLKAIPVQEVLHEAVALLKAEESIADQT